MARIREIRKEMNLSQAQFGALLGVHQTAVSQWEKGRTHPDIETLIRLSRLSGMSLETILFPPGETIAETGNVPLFPYRASAPCETARRAKVCPGVPGCDFAVEMADDSMTGARIFAGDTVYFINTPHIESGAVHAVDTGEGILIRRVYRLADGRLMFSPENNRFAPELAPDGARILGRAFCFHSML